MIWNKIPKIFKWQKFYITQEKKYQVAWRDLCNAFKDGHNNILKPKMHKQENETPS